MTSPERQEIQSTHNTHLVTDHRPKGASEFWRDRWLWILLILALFLRVAYNLVLHPDHVDWYSFIIDEREYFGAAQMFAEGRGFSFFDTALWVRPPLYVALLGGLFTLLRQDGSFYLPVLVVQSVLSVASLLPLGLLAFRQGGRKAARWCVMLGVVYLPFTLFAGLLLSETLFVFLFAWVILALDTAVNRLADGWDRSTLTSFASAGILVGLATLTRSSALSFVPFIALWIFICLRGGTRANRRNALAASSLFALISILVIMPWTLRNLAAYGRLIPVDTTSGYNLWLGSVGVRDEERLQADLLRIKNPAERQSYALARGWENITADPASFVGRGVKESLDLLRPLFSAEERQVRGYSSGRVPAWHLAFLFVFDDILYAVILLSAAVSLFLSATPLRSLTILWVVVSVIVAFVFFAVTRFRLPLVAALLPWAGLGLARLSTPADVMHSFKRSRPRERLGVAVALLLVVLVVLPALAGGETLLGIQRWQAQAPFRRGEDLLKAGRTSKAIAQYALADKNVPDTRYALAAAYLQEGDKQAALDQLLADEPPRRFEPYLIRGEAARSSGDLAAARSFFNDRTVNLAGDESLRWAWDHLRPPDVTSIDVGSGLDVGYIRGFYSAEAGAEGSSRWTLGQAEVRHLVLSNSGKIALDWNGWRPGQLPAARVEVESGAGKQVMSIVLPKDTSWSRQEVTLQANPGSGGASMVMPTIRLSINPFVGSGNDPRLLGVRVTRISVAP